MCRGEEINTGSVIFPISIDIVEKTARFEIRCTGKKLQAAGISKRSTLMVLDIPKKSEYGCAQFLP